MNEKRIPIPKEISVFIVNSENQIPSICLSRRGCGKPCSSSTLNGASSYLLARVMFDGVVKLLAACSQIMGECRAQTENESPASSAVTVGDCSAIPRSSFSTCRFGRGCAIITVCRMKSSQSAIIATGPGADESDELKKKKKADICKDTR